MKKILSLILIAVMLLGLATPINGFAVMSGGLVAGGNHTFAIMADGTVKAWGYNNFGQLGLGDSSDKKTPTTIAGLNDVKQLVAGGNHSLALMNDGTVKSWGRNNYGQLGLVDNIIRYSPTTIPGLTGVKQLAAGTNHSLALMEDGTVKAWGYNTEYELGTGNNVNRFVPTLVTGLINVKSIISSSNHSFAILEDGTVKAWGYNYFGQTGFGDGVQRTTPIEIVGLFGAKQIVTGENFSMALMNDGAVKSWGVNSNGELGLGNRTNRTSLTTILGLTGVEHIRAGGNQAFAILNDGTVKAWGYNSEGELGIGSTTGQNSPTVMTELASVKQLVTGAYHALALMNDGTVKSWGYNSQGQLGLGDIAYRVTPTLLNIIGVSFPVDEDTNALKITEATTSVVMAEISKTQEDIDAAWSLVAALTEGTDKTLLSDRLDAVQLFIEVEKAKLQSISDAIAAVVKVESSKTQVDIDAARLLVNALHDCSEKSTLLSRLNAINIGPIIVSQEYKAADTKINLAMSLPREPYLSLALLAIEKVTDSVEKAALVAEMQIAIEKSTASKPMTVKTANLFVRLAEITGRGKYITLAESKTSQITDEVEKQDAITRMDIAKLVKSPAERRAYSSLIAAEQWKSTNMIAAATKLINALADGSLKTNMLERVNSIN